MIVPLSYRVLGDDIHNQSHMVDASNTSGMLLGALLVYVQTQLIHGIAANYLLGHTDMPFNIHGHDTREAGSMNLYFPTVQKDMYIYIYTVLGGKLWKGVLDVVKNSTNRERLNEISELTKV